MTNPNAPSTERLREIAGTSEVRALLPRPVDQLEGMWLASEFLRLRAALRRIAAFDDKWASDRLAKTDSYSYFDEPFSADIARRALNGGTSDAE